MGDLQLSLGSPSRSPSIFFLLLHGGETWQRGGEVRAADAARVPVLTHPHPLPSQARHHGGSQPRQLTGTSSTAGAGALASPRAVPGSAPTTTFLVFSLFFFLASSTFSPLSCFPPEINFAAEGCKVFTFSPANRRQ